VNYFWHGPRISQHSTCIRGLLEPNHMPSPSQSISFKFCYKH
jgi:hypothetical protein